MASNKMKRVMEDVKREFKRSTDPREVEKGLDTDDSGIMQLRKACRLLQASKKLVEENGYYTLVIDASFVAMERSVQAILLEKGIIEEGETVFDHEKILDKGEKAGIYGEDFKNDLKQIWSENRSKHYYRYGKPTEKRAEKIQELAESLHEQVKGMSSEGYKCICST